MSRASRLSTGQESGQGYSNLVDPLKRHGRDSQVFGDRDILFHTVPELFAFMPWTCLVPAVKGGWEE